MVKLNELFLGSHFLTLKAFKSLGAEQVNLALICAPPMSRRLGWIVRSVEFFPFFSSTLAAEKCRGFSPLKTVRLSEKEDRRPLSRTFFFPGSGRNQPVQFRASIITAQKNISLAATVNDWQPNWTTHANRPVKAGPFYDKSPRWDLWHFGRTSPPKNANQSVPIVNLLATDIHLCPVTANQLLMNSQSAKNNLTASRKVVNGPSMTWRNGGVHPPNKMKRINNFSNVYSPQIC